MSVIEHDTTSSPSTDHDRPVRVLVVYGTRPEAIKMAPLVLALDRHPAIHVEVAVTGQHREMLDQVNDTFGIVPTHDLNIHAAGQTLTQVTCRTLTGLEQVLTDHRPDIVLVQGDTTTTFAAALAAFYAQIPVVHAEAGLRTADRWSPYPEEINRRLTTHLSSLHLPPTDLSRDNLLTDGIHEDSVIVTGNSVIDALLWTVAQSIEYSDPHLSERLAEGRPMVLVTAHRRESWGEPMKAIGRALGQLAQRFPDHDFVFPMHRNPLVRDAIRPSIEGVRNVLIAEPLPYPEFCHVMDRSMLVLTDSGGIQEEGPSLGKPVLVMRENTERPEAVDAGTARLIGTDEQTIVDAVTELLTDPVAHATMAQAMNPYGDGQAAERTVEAILHHFGRADRPEEFSPETAAYAGDGAGPEAVAS